MLREGPTESADADGRTSAECLRVPPSIYRTLLLLRNRYLCHASITHETLSLPDLNALDPHALDPAALNVLLLAHHEQDNARLSSRLREIERLFLLVGKLKHVPIGRKSQKVIRHIERLVLQLEEVSAADAVEERRTAVRAARPAPG